METRETVDESTFMYMCQLANWLRDHLCFQFCYYYGQCDSTSSTQDVIAGVRDYYACLQLCMDYTDDEGCNSIDI